MIRNSPNTPAGGLLLPLLLLGCTMLMHVSAHTAPSHNTPRKALPPRLSTNHSTPLNQTLTWGSAHDEAGPGGRRHNQTKVNSSSHWTGPWDATEGRRRDPRDPQLDPPDRPEHGGSGEHSAAEPHVADEQLPDSFPSGIWSKYGSRKFRQLLRLW